MLQRIKDFFGDTFLKVKIFVSPVTSRLAQIEEHEWKISLYLFLTIIVLLVLFQNYSKGVSNIGLVVGLYRFAEESMIELTSKVSFPSQEKVQKLIKYFFIGLCIFTFLVTLQDVMLKRIAAKFYRSLFDIAKSK